MTKKEIAAAVKRAVKTGNWMLRVDNDGVSYEGFRWAPIGEWTECERWNQAPVCGGGLHGVNHLASGFSATGTHVSFCETDGEQVVVGENKIKVRRARRLLVNEIPAGVKLGGGLYLHGTAITSLTIPAGVKLGGGLNLSGCTSLTSLTIPAGVQLGGGLNLRGTPLEGKYELVDGRVVEKEGKNDHL